MESKKTALRKRQMERESGGDRRTGSVGERPELIGSNTGGDRRAGSGEADRATADEQETEESL